MNENIEETKKVLSEIEQMIEQKVMKDMATWLQVLNMYFALLNELFDLGEEKDKQESCKKGIKVLNPILEKMLLSKKINDEEFNEVGILYNKNFAFVSRRSFHHFILYMEEDRALQNKVYINRQSVLKDFAFYLNKMLFETEIKYLIASYPPSYAKTFMLNYFSAFCYGVDMNSSIIRLSYGDDLVKSMSRNIREIIKHPRYKEIFPSFKKLGNRIFSKETDSDWKINGVDSTKSHIARTREGSTTGERANKFIMLDDMIKNATESTNNQLHNQIYNSWQTEWRNRVTDGNVRFIIVGTMWSPHDIMNRIVQDIEKDTEFIEHPTKKYICITKDKQAIQIRVPLIDNEKSTCDNVWSTEDALKLRRDTDHYFFSCVYQQDPIAPSGLEFEWSKIEQYEFLPSDLPKYCKATLDPSRKGRDFASMPIFCEGEEKSYLVDCLFRKEAITELYDEIIRMVKKYHIIELLVESNTDTSLKTLLEIKLEENGITYCTVLEKYNTQNKEKRIADMRGLIKKHIVFPYRANVIPNTDMGRFMLNLTLYSFDFPNKNDDAPDSVAMYVSELLFTSAVDKMIEPLSWVRNFI